MTELILPVTELILPTEYVRTRNGINWVKEPLPGWIKCLTGTWGEHQVKVGNHFLTDAGYRQLEDFLKTTSSFFKPIFDASVKRPVPYGKTVGHRVRYCLAPDNGMYKGCKGELKRFRVPEFQLLSGLASEVVANPRRVYEDEIYERLERMLELRYSGHPGVYVRQDIELPWRIYLGEGEDVEDRGGGHLNSPLYCVRIYPTYDKKIAGILQNMIFDKLERMGVEVVDRYRKSRKTKGLMKFNIGTDGLKIIDKIVAEDCKRLVLHTKADILR